MTRPHTPLLRLLIVGISSVVLLAANTASSNAKTTLGRFCVPGSGGLASELVIDPGTVAPTSGVITRWSMVIPPDPPPGSSVTFFVIKSTGVANLWTIDSKQTELLPSSGGTLLLDYPARMPIAAGEAVAELFNVGGSGFGSFGCASSGSLLSVSSLTSIPEPGNTINFNTSAGDLISDIAADVEPDADRDGFGDETQDGCPQSAAIQLSCPTSTSAGPPVVPILGAIDMAFKRGLYFFVTSNVAGSAHVEASVTLPRVGKRHRRHRGRSVRASSARLTFDSTSVATGPGLLSKLTLRYPSQLSSVLAKMSKHKHLTLVATVTVRSPSSVASKVVSVRLPGAAKRKRRH